MNTLRLEIINLHAPYKVLQFVRWFNIYERRHLFIIRTAEGMIHLKSPHNFIFKVI